VHTPAVALKQRTYHGLRGDALILRQERPTLPKPVFSPFVVSDVLRVVSKMITDEMNDPPPRHQQGWCTPTKAPVGEELRRRLG
jgi:hypothetical protein